MNNYHHHLEFIYVSQLAFSAEMNCDVNYRVAKVSGKQLFIVLFFSEKNRFISVLACTW